MRSASHFRDMSADTAQLRSVLDGRSAASRVVIQHANTHVELCRTICGVFTQVSTLRQHAPKRFGDLELRFGSPMPPVRALPVQTLTLALSRAICSAHARLRGPRTAPLTPNTFRPSR